MRSPRASGPRRARRCRRGRGRSSARRRGGARPRRALLRAVDRPLGGEVAAVLARVRVADHHLGRWRPRGLLQQLVEDRRRRREVVERLEERDDRERLVCERRWRRGRRQRSTFPRRSACRAPPGHACAARDGCCDRLAARGSPRSRACRRRSSFAMWNPKSSTIRSSRATRPSPIRRPPFAARLSRIVRRSASSSLWPGEARRCRAATT